MTTTAAATPAAEERYSAVAIALHWIIALALAWQLSLGFGMESLPRADRGAAMGVHKALGITILVLSLARLAWRLTHKPPPLPAGMPALDRALSSAVHVGFYVIMIGAPLGGWAMSSASTRAGPISFWGLFDVPKLPLPKSDALAGQLYVGHAAAGYLALLLIALHIAGVVKHMFGDGRDVLWRMVPGLDRPSS
ncbi:MAG: cytochrome b [Hyphomonadaceae bacterium]|nr:cytochrome b [Hyphomonadaceae bacterium]